MSRREIRQLEKMIEIVARAIPKEAAASKLYGQTAEQAEREMTRMLFTKLHRDAQEHEAKLRATLNILKRQLERLRRPEAAEAEPPGPAHEFNVNIRRTMRISKELRELSEKGLGEADDPSCRAMYERMRAVAHELHDLAASEVERHVDADKWD
jgi:rubrerythrin